MFKGSGIGSFLLCCPTFICLPSSQITLLPSIDTHTQPEGEREGEREQVKKGRNARNDLLLTWRDAFQESQTLLCVHSRAGGTK